jgi:hypothetical protein
MVTCVTVPLFLRLVWVLVLVCFLAVLGFPAVVVFPENSLHFIELAGQLLFTVDKAKMLVIVVMM